MASEPARQSMSLEELGRFVWRGLGLALAVAALAAVVAFAITREQRPVYRASAALLASQPGGSYGGTNVIAPPPVDASAYQAAILEGPVVADALAAVDGRVPGVRRLEAFKKSLRVTLDKQDLSSVIHISVDSTEPAYAARVANAIANGLIAWDRDRARATFARSVAALQQAVQQLDASLAASGLDAATRRALQAQRAQRAAELEAAQSRSASSVFVGLLEPLAVAVPPTEAIGPRVVFRTFVAALLGLFGAYGLLFLRWSLDPRLRNREDLEVLGAPPTLAEFPARPRKDGSLSAEAASFLRAKLLGAHGHQAPLVIAVTSAESLREKAGVAAGLAESFARAGIRTLLVDADLRSGGVVAGLDPRSVQGAPLEAHLEEPERSYPPATVGVDASSSFDVVPGSSGTRHPAELLGRGLPAKLERWSADYDVVVLDAPPVLPFADTLTLAPLCSGVVMCAGIGTSRRARVSEGVALLRSTDVELLGTVVTNGARPRRRAARSYRTGAPDGRAARPQRAPARGAPRDDRAMTNVRTNPKRPR